MDILIPAKRIQERVAELAREINDHYQGRPITIIGVLTGSLIFLADLVRRLRKEGTLVILSELYYQPLQALDRSTVIDDVGPENIATTLDTALAVAREHLEARRITTTHS